MSKTQIRPKLRDRAQTQPVLLLGDRVKIAGLSQHVGTVVAIKTSPYSGTTISVKVGSKRLEGVNPLALTKLC